MDLGISESHVKAEVKYMYTYLIVL